MKDLPAWGVDVTAVAVRGVKLERNPEGQPCIVAWDLHDFTEQVEDVSAISRFQVMARGLRHYKSRHDLKYSQTWVSLRAETAFNRTVTVPPVSDDSLDKILGYEAQQQIPFPLEEVYWDRRVLAIRENGEVLATLYAVRKSMVEDRLRKFENAGLPVDGLQIRPVALHNFCAFERILENGTVVVDIDYAGFQVLIHHDDHTWFRAIPEGGVDFVEALQERLRLTHAQAVRAAAGDSKPRDAQAFQGVRDDLSRQLAEEVARTVRYYVAARPGLKLKNIVLFESHPCVPPMGDALRKALGLEVTRPSGFKHIQVDPDVVSAGIQEHFAALSKACGLALQGIGKAEVDIRLFPATLARKRTPRLLGYYVAAALLLLFVAVVAWIHKQNADEVSQAERTTRQALAGASQRDDVERIKQPRAPIADLARLARPAIDRDRTLRIYEHIMSAHAAWSDGDPPQVWVKLDQSRPGELVLAQVETESPETLDARMDTFARSLADKVHIASVRPAESWTAARPSGEPPPGPAAAMVRWRFRHRKYVLDTVPAGAAP